jgi:cytoplasmic iron level regulating protein YaaA (DUF328/UPF0246 family)
LIPCCGEKTKHGTESYQILSRNSIISYLSKEKGERLLKLRKQVALAFRETPGPDLGFETDNPEIKFLEAYKRYRGNLYSKIANDSWNKLERNPKIRLIIVSALYGLVNYNEPIRNYNRSMKDHITPERLLKTWWKMHSLADILLNYVRLNEIKEVHDFLSNDYRDALTNLPWRYKSIGVLYFPHDYPGLGSGSDFHRGIDVNKLIQKA